MGIVTLGMLKSLKEVPCQRNYQLQLENGSRENSVEPLSTGKLDEQPVMADTNRIGRIVRGMKTADSRITEITRWFGSIALLIAKNLFFFGI